jgi:hypothetical protein
MATPRGSGFVFNDHLSVAIASIVETALCG